MARPGQGGREKLQGEHRQEKLIAHGEKSRITTKSNARAGWLGKALFHTPEQNKKNVGLSEDLRGRGKRGAAKESIKKCMCVYIKLIFFPLHFSRFVRMLGGREFEGGSGV